MNGSGLQIQWKEHQLADPSPSHERPTCTGPWRGRRGDYLALKTNREQPPQKRQTINGVCWSPAYRNEGLMASEQARQGADQGRM